MPPHRYKRHSSLQLTKPRIKWALRCTAGRQNQAAALLGVSVRTLRSAMVAHNLKVADFRHSRTLKKEYLDQYHRIWGRYRGKYSPAMARRAVADASKRAAEVAKKVNSNLGEQDLETIRAAAEIIKRNVLF